MMKKDFKGIFIAILIIFEKPTIVFHHSFIESK